MHASRLFLFHRAYAASHSLVLPTPPLPLPFAHIRRRHRAAGGLPALRVFRCLTRGTRDALLWSGVGVRASVRWLVGRLLMRGFGSRACSVPSVTRVLGTALRVVWWALRSSVGYEPARTLARPSCAAFACLEPQT